MDLKLVKEAHDKMSDELNSRLSQNKKIDLKVIELELVPRKEPIEAFENLGKAISEFKSAFINAYLKTWPGKATIFLLDKLTQLPKK